MIIIVAQHPTEWQGLSSKNLLDMLKLILVAENDQTKLADYKYMDKDFGKSNIKQAQAMAIFWHEQERIKELAFWNDVPELTTKMPFHVRPIALVGNTKIIACRVCGESLSLKNVFLKEIAFRNGNTEIGDGPKYKGKGLIQLTWKNNYLAYSEFKEIGDFFVDSPLLIAQNMSNAIDVSCYYWIKRGNVWKGYKNNKVIGNKHTKDFYNTRNINILIENEPNNIRAVTHAVNGGQNGFEHRKVMYELIKKEWSLEQNEKISIYDNRIFYI